MTIFTLWGSEADFEFRKCKDHAGKICNLNLLENYDEDTFEDHGDIGMKPFPLKNEELLAFSSF